MIECECVQVEDNMRIAPSLLKCELHLCAGLAPAAACHAWLPADAAGVDLPCKPLLHGQLGVFLAAAITLY